MRLAVVLATAGFCTALFAPGLYGAEPSAPGDREDQLRAGYLLNFVKFVEWPASAATDPWTFCFVGGDGVRDAIAAATHGKQVNARAVAIRSLAKGESSAGCQLLYVDATAPFANEHIGGETSPALLTVSDARNFIHIGGVVQLFAEGNRLRFNISLDNARRAGLRISSSLLELASHVEETGR